VDEPWLARSLTEEPATESSVHSIMCHLQVFRGSTRQLSALPRPTAAIPSKFETVINVGAKEKDGFGARSYRFKTLENDMPGPGACLPSLRRTRESKA
jgi:hypothetical protein